MGYNKVIPIFLLFIMAIFVMGVQPANAVKSQLKLYNYDGSGTPFGSEYYIKKGKSLEIVQVSILMVEIPN